MFSRRARFWLIVGLLVSNLAVGVVSLLYLRSVDQRYAKLIERSIPVVNNLRTLTREMSAVQRLARRVVDPDNEPTWKELPPLMDVQSDRTRVMAIDLSNAEVFQSTLHSASIARLARDYDAKVDVFLDLVRQNRLTEANQYNIDTLRPAYDRFQLQLDAAADYVESQSNDLRTRYAEDSRWFGGLLMAFAGWPVIVAALGLVVLLLLVAALLATIFTPDFSWPRRTSGRTES